MWYLILVLILAVAVAIWWRCRRDEIHACLQALCEFNAGGEK